jgi:hypothetical protein
MAEHDTSTQTKAKTQAEGVKNAQQLPAEQTPTEQELREAEES